MQAVVREVPDITEIKVNNPPPVLQSKPSGPSINPFAKKANQPTDLGKKTTGDIFKDFGGANTSTDKA
jgi:hypothetical protein